MVIYRQTAANMSFLGNPKLLYFIRIGQLLLGVLFLVLICYDGTHRAWWSSINGPLAVGVISSVFTFAITVHSMYVSQGARSAQSINLCAVNLADGNLDSPTTARTRSLAAAPPTLLPGSRLRLLSFSSGSHRQL